ncbi:DUF4102 domain-containing protein [Granulicella sp. 5B5]|nr:DUF4102 domain-containing protein [Granulicella sp. 5B5]
MENKCSCYQYEADKPRYQGGEPRDKPFKLFDGHGLFLLVNPGGSKLWCWRYRFNRKEKLMALGEYLIVSLSCARASL